MKHVQYLALAVVAAAAVVLSFTTLRDLALACGYSDGTAWLLPVVIDAGAAAGAIAWLHGAGPARRFGRVLALVLLAASVGGNALGHGLAAHQSVAVAQARPGWLVVVGVSAVAPAVLGAVVHLAMVAGRTGRTDPDQPDDQPARTVLPLAVVRLPDEQDQAADDNAGEPVGGPVDQLGELVGQPPPGRDASDDVLAADLRDHEADQPAQLGRDAIARRYSVGSTRAARVRQLADEPPTADQLPDHADHDPPA